MPGEANTGGGDNDGVKKLLAMRVPVPTFDPTSFDLYLTNLDMWSYTSMSPKNMRGALLFQSLPNSHPSGIKQRISDQLSLADLKHEESFERIIAILKEAFAKEKEAENYAVFKEFLYIKRKDNESMLDYVTRFCGSKVKAAKHDIKLGDTTKAYHLLETSRISEQDKRAVLAQLVGKVDSETEETVFKAAVAALKTILGESKEVDSGGVEGVKLDGVFLTQEEEEVLASFRYKKKNSGSFNNSQQRSFKGGLAPVKKPRNPIDPNTGVIMRCASCDSKSHLVKDCYDTYEKVRARLQAQTLKGEQLIAEQKGSDDDENPVFFTQSHHSQLRMCEDLKERSVDKLNYILYGVDMFSSLVFAVFLSTKRTEEVVDKIFTYYAASGTCIPKKFYSDMGSEFCSNTFREMCEMFGVEVLTTAPYSPWSNGKVEKIHHIVDTIYEKVSLSHPDLPCTTVLSWSCFAKNQWPSSTLSGYSAYQLHYGSSPAIPDVTTATLPQLNTVVSSSKVHEHMKAMEACHKAHSKAMFSKKIKEALLSKIRAQQQIFTAGEKVYYKRDQVKGPEGHMYKGPAMVLGRRGQVYWIVHQNKVLACGATCLIAVEDAEETVQGDEDGATLPAMEEEKSDDVSPVSPAGLDITEYHEELVPRLNVTHNQQPLIPVDPTLPIPSTPGSPEHTHGPADDQIDHPVLDLHPAPQHLRVGEEDVTPPLDDEETTAPTQPAGVTVRPEM